MRVLARLGLGLGVLVVTAGALLTFQGTPSAWSATGNVLADIAPPASIGGVSVAFDGHDIYYTDLGGAVLHRSSPSGFANTDIPLLGGVGINAIAYDATHDVFWGVDATGLNVYRIERDGWVGLQFTIVPLLDLPGLCNSLSGCSPTVSGLGYDATTDSLWYLPQGSSRVYHFNTAGQPLGYFDTTNFPDCATNGVTGIAAGASVLYLTAGNCSRGFQYGKTGAKLSSVPVGGTQSAGAACDDVTFAGTTALWVRDAASGHLRAIEVPAGSCALGGGLALDKSAGWMSGAGEAGVFDISGTLLFPVQHAFHILCAQTDAGVPNSMVINWKDATSGIRYSFHLDRVTSFRCFNDGTSAASPPPCYSINPDDCFNTIVGEGVGSLVGRDGGNQIVAGGKTCPASAFPPFCGLVDFTFTDRGEPNLGGPRQNPPPPGTPTFDNGEFTVTDLSDRPGNPVAVVAACGCERANYQANNKSVAWAPVVPLGTADSFANLAGSGITNTGPTTVSGDLGTYPIPTITGLATLTMIGGNHGGDEVTQAAKTDLVTAYDTAVGLKPTSPIVADLGGKTLTPGVYNSASSIGLTGTLTLDGGGNPNATFVFQAGSTLTTASASQVNLINGAKSCNVFWQVGSSATLGTGSNFRGTILALTSITVTTGVNVDGRVLARNGAVTLDSNKITKSSCKP
jgi:hypothetical protein